MEKTSLQITETEESLDGFIKLVSEYNEKYKQIQNDVTSLMPSDLLSLESDLAKTTLLNYESNLKSKTFQGELDEIDSKIPKLVSEIEDKLRQFSNTKYTISTS